MRIDWCQGALVTLFAKAFSMMHHIVSPAVSSVMLSSAGFRHRDYKFAYSPEPIILFSTINLPYPLNSGDYYKEGKRGIPVIL
jgi:hypothetical protein